MKAVPRSRRVRTPLERLQAKSKRTAAQDALAFQLKAAKISCTPEYQWNPKTKQRADFLVFGRGFQSLLVEVDGGLYINGGHTRGAARERDYERDAEAMMLGFKVLRVSPRQVKQGKAIQWITSLLK